MTDALTQQEARRWLRRALNHPQVYIDSPDCLMQFLAKALDNEQPQPCSRCARCLGQPVIDERFSLELAAEAAWYLRQAELPLECKKQAISGAFTIYPFRSNLAPLLRAETGRVLSRWGDAGWGRLVAEDKRAGHFRDELVEAMADMIQQRWRPQPAPTWLTCIPSRNHPTRPALEIEMDLHPQAQAILLLTVYFSRVTGEEPRPLSPTEWGRFARWLKEHEIAPEMLLRDEPARLLEGWTDRTVTVERVQKLLNRAGALGLAMEKWQRVGLWVLIRADVDYPGRLKKRLQALSPPVFFGCGNRRLLDQGGIGVVGSRHASPEDLVFTSRLGSQAALQGLSIISGGARGVDETAMVGALAQEGTVVGVLADGLLRAATSARFRPSLINGSLALISPFNPEAGFDVGNAMARNKYIYCLADAAVVIAADREKGGTWSGAVENLKQGWAPLWIKSHPDAQSGNAELVRQGARWLPETPGELAALCTREPARMVESVLDLVAEPAPPVLQRQVAGQSVETADGVIDHLSFYQLFLRRLQVLAAKTPATDQELLERLDIGKPQLQEWLKRAMAEGQVKRLNKPVRYQWQATRPEQNSFFAHS